MRDRIGWYRCTRAGSVREVKDALRVYLLCEYRCVRLLGASSPSIGLPIYSDAPLRSLSLGTLLHLPP